jgi:transcriptional regulator with XRE-family HTH domain
MDALTYLNLYGKEKATKVAKKAGTNYAYFSQIAYGHRRPSVELALKLVEASKQELDFVSLLTHKSAA